jgi:hypothetical protein
MNQNMIQAQVNPYQTPLHDLGGMNSMPYPYSNNDYGLAPSYIQVGGDNLNSLNYPIQNP